MQSATSRCGITKEDLLFVLADPSSTSARYNLKHCTKKIMSAKRPHHIERLDATIHTFSQFFRLMARNSVVILENISTNWPCSKTWRNSNGSICSSYLQHSYSNATVNVAHCNVQEFNDQKRSFMCFGEFLERFKQCDDGEVLYLKDWHLTQAYPNPVAYVLPLFFSDDWINQYWDNKRITNSATEDYRFVYMGQKGSFTPLHKDVFRSYSWSTNIVGTKKWTLFPVEDTYYLFGGINNKETVWDIREWENDSMLQKKFPHFGKAKPLVYIQHEGETIFVPSGWYHQVENLEDTISINHNWGNGCNVDFFWDFLQLELADVEYELQEWRECEDWKDLCQKVMAAHTGIHFEGFIEYLLFSTENQIARSFSFSLSASQKEINLFLYNAHKIVNLMKEIDLCEPQCPSYVCLKEKVQFLKEIAGKWNDELYAGSIPIFL